jgi:carbon starvation protein
MSLALFALCFIAVLMLGHRLYGGWVARQLRLNDARPTPAHARADGADYVPTPPFYLFAQHFSAIAAAGPIAGPILACQNFGWLPCLLWITFGVIFIGAVHDFSALVASLRHGGNSIAEIARERLGTAQGRAMMAFIWIALVYVIVAFTDITAGSFVQGTEELEASGERFNPGGAVAAASVLYLLLSVVMGLLQRFLAPPLWLVTVIFVPATFGLAWAGTHLSHWLVFDGLTWSLAILCYCCIASVTPVWLLLQPRGYLGGFVLYSAIAIGVIGMLFGGYEVRQPAFTGFDAGGATGALMPFLFVTIACGACSGFHGLVCSGTTSKQLDRESHSHVVGYGAMLAEGFVAVIALVTIVIFTREELAGMKPGAIYGRGIGEFLTILIGRENLPFAITFGAMAFSTFVFDTLDVATRLGRYLVQELIGRRGLFWASLGVLLTIGPAALMLMSAGTGGYLKFWTLFGASNQLLAALTLLSIAVWMRSQGRTAWFLILPMSGLLVTTLWALSSLALSNWRAAQGVDAAMANALAAGALILLALYLVASGLARARSGSAIRSEP